MVMEAVSTYVFMDLETTGLLNDEFGPTKITEIAFIAVRREHILDKHKGVPKENICNHNLLPRVLNKLNIALYPRRMINPTASQISGLTNENLVHQGHFDENMYNMINLFLERLEKPFCLVAHNGNRFDFPLLQSELMKIGKTLSDDVFCVDSLHGFRKVLAEQAEIPVSENCSTIEDDIVPLDVISLNSNSKPSGLVPKCGWSSEEYNSEMVQVAELAEKLAEDKSFNAKDVEIKIQREMERMRKINEQTPVRKSKKPLADHSVKEHSARRRLLNNKQPKKKYDMKSLHESLTGKKIVDAHQAEVDAVALLECITAVGRPILEWMDNNRIPFRAIKKIW